MPSDDGHHNRVYKHDDNVVHFGDDRYDYVADDDRPDVEFNDDGSVHINTPGDYNFGIVNGNVVAVYDRAGELIDSILELADPDDPALD
jgi:hypothetical protein